MQYAIKQVQNILIVIMALYILPVNAEVLEAPAVIDAKNQALLASQLHAKIDKINVKPGDYFKKGDILLEFNCNEQYAELEALRADFESANANYKSQKKLKKFKSTSELEYAQAEAEYKKNKAKVSQFEHKLVACEIKAPFSGEVVDVLQHPHHIVQPDENLIEIVNNDNLFLKIIVPSIWLKWLAKGATGQVELSETNGDFKFKVSHIGAKVDAASQTVEVYAQIQQHDKVIAGMSGIAKFNKE